MSDPAADDHETTTQPRAHHVGITVADLDRAVDFYTETFGFDLIAEFSVGGEAFSSGVGVPDATGTFAHLDADGVRLELVEYEPAGEPLPSPSLNRSGAVHFGLCVEDLEVFHSTLDPAVETISDPKRTESGTEILFVRDPEGNLVEVLETG
ncbi:VOC family protein [Halorubrum vacuolatum]|uniref:Catechol 2,3-dioxygenase n=1 Tax=Halorubrum vacuolatum TaxID=63740 RepID=A0A238WYP7_HALVU|nr:VOC family protein [Halorubrum vacuolatum]SNR51582.1 Catechol 2,3-dioxygenase [Halorubrum vacuolatum]